MADKQRISAFDLDHTLFNGNSSFLFGRFLCRKKHLPKSALLFILWCQVCHLIGILSITCLHKNAFKYLFCGKSSTLVKLWVEEFLSQYFDDLIYQPAMEQLKRAQKEGHLTVILSSSPDFLVEPIAQRLGVNLWKSTQYAIDKDGLFCKIAELMLGEDKACFITSLQMQKGSLRQDVSAYSDSYLDLPFLLAAGTAIGVNPDRKLRAICHTKHWRVI